jgi:hypothetical protein
VNILVAVGFGGAPLPGGLLVTGVDLLLHARFGLLRLSRLSRLGCSSCGGSRAAPGESTTAQATRQDEQCCQASHMRVYPQIRATFLQFTRPDR